MVPVKLATDGYLFRRCANLAGAALLALLLAIAVKPAGAQPAPAEAGGGDLELGDEYSEFSRRRGEKARPSIDDDSSGVRTALLYLPNRLLDFIDIFRVDAGVGPSTGAVVRVTKWGQAGMRYFSPASLRVGLRGRKIPVFLERSSEFGVGPAFVQSRERRVTPAEVGVGVDLLVGGVYAGISLDSVADFVCGIFLFDFADDDLR